MSNAGHGLGSSAAIILVLFILLVIITKGILC
ncbi:YjcZ family sporulation protein [Paenibacillus rhizovicinus]|uniref:YjcZ family sporulation protein n=1 Tax=Paenibacillus rhizovicinus TaxID=2704463 RepID=A0A6C0NWK1_9BACL|nr:YjcZ family sporulation protein [Paenibacillus rhizovicinus]QHW30590.1 YjcZ family sporulation protein [Paenibacillus rhizovicinus]